MALDIARLWVESERLSLDYKQASADSLPFGEDTFDAAVLNSVLDHMSLSRASAAMEEARRVVKPGGVVFVSVSQEILGPH